MLYCGGKKLPAGKVYGTSEECKGKHQLRLYGKYAITNPEITSLKSTGDDPVYCGAKKSKRKHGTAEQCKSKRQLRLYGVFVNPQTTPKPKTLTPKPKTLTPKSKTLTPKSKTLTPKSKTLTPKPKTLTTKAKTLAPKPKTLTTKTKTLTPKPKTLTNVKAKAVTKLAAVVKMKQAKKLFNKMMQNVNSAQFRRKKRKLLLDILNVQLHSQFKSKTVLYPESIVTKIKVLSRDETASGASVLSLQTDSFGTLVCKFTPLPKLSTKPDPGRFEICLYDKIMNHLVDDNVTPFIMKSLLTSNDLSKSSFCVVRKDMHPSIQKEIKLNNNKKLRVLLTESVDAANITSLQNFLKTNGKTINEITNVLLQVLWTLECFNRIGFRHNDLHLGNILVVKHARKSKNTHRIFKYTCTKTKQVKKVYLPVIEWEVRIFDFDRSGKARMKNLKSVYNTAYHLNYEPFTDWDMSLWTDNTLNSQYDTYKIMSELPKTGDFNFNVNGYTYSTRLLNKERDIIMNKYHFNSLFFEDYGFCIDSHKGTTNIKIDGYPSTIDIFEHIVKLQKYNRIPKKESRLIEIYDMNNIKKSKH